MKSVLKKYLLGVAAFGGLIFSGCYTEVSTLDNDHQQYAYTDESDTTVTDKDVTINNNYYLDDDYRQSRFRLSFNYYYPTYQPSWIAGYYYSYYDDWNFGWHQPFYYNDWCYNPHPYWYHSWYYDPFYNPYPYYYYHTPGYAYAPPSNPGRIRNNGPSRDAANPNGRTRSNPSIPSPGTAVATTSPTPRVRETARDNDAQPVTTRRRAEVPWWERVNNEQQRTRDNEARNSGNAVRPGERQRVDSGPTQGTKSGDARQNNRRRESSPAYSPPARRNNSGDAKPAERQRGRREQSYSPPTQNRQPAYSPPPSNTGGRGRGGESSGGGGRKRSER
ncbi:MAG: hypothetical protein PHP42_00410 [Bacteroidota bacterium]|nr:hypothetical protein [Bacteroidota bacterium]